MKHKQITQEPPLPLPREASLNTIVWLAEMNRRTKEAFVFPAEYVDKIIDTVCECFNVKKEDMIGPSRMATIHLPRKLAMWVCVYKTNASLNTIGKKFGRRDHTTVIHTRDMVTGLFEARDESLMAAWKQYKVFAPPFLVPSIPSSNKKVLI